MADPKHLNPIYTDEAAARAHFEALRWPDGRVCPHCGVIGNSTELKGATTRPGLYKCKVKECRKPFTAIMGTVYEGSHIPLHIWLYATHLMCASKKGISAAQLHRMLGFGSYKSAWFMAHRIREAMRTENLSPMGSDGGDVMADETFFGKDPDAGSSRMAIRNMNKIVTLLDRTSGQTRSIVVKENLSAETVAAILNANISPKARLLTDEATHYKTPGRAFADHKTVNHRADEYVSRLDPTITTNQIEGFFGIFKRGMRGVYQHCGSQHLHRYLSEFDFRYTNRSAVGVEDAERTARAIKGAVGRRLRYKKPDGQATAQA